MAYSDDGDHAPYINLTAGNPDHALSVGGGGHVQTGRAFYDDCAFHYSCTGLTIESDTWLGCDGWHYTDVWFGLYDGYGTPTFDAIVRLNFNKGAQEHNIEMHLYSCDPNHAEAYSIAQAYTCEQWNTGKIAIRPDGKVEFYVNDTLLWTSTKTIDPSYAGVAKVFFGGSEANGPAYADSLLVYSDCNENGVPDDQDLADCDGSPWCSDCNGNGILDECDIVCGNDTDFNGNGILDECECLGDLDGDGDVDLADLATLLARYGARCN